MSWLSKLFGKKNAQPKGADMEKKESIASIRDRAPKKDNGKRSDNSRNIRVFISSTFQDMQQERDVLIKKIFPQLRKMCAERGVGFTEVDLRWGVTKEQVERGEVLPICLAEIEHCQPYFIGLLGERYGWVPDSIHPELIRDMPWLKEHLEKSVTELEILHGVLNNPEMADHAFFYFRDPTSPLTISEEKPESSRKLEKLKDRIRKNGFPVKENYPDPETLGQMILEDLEKAIDKQYPALDLTPLDRERLDHEAFAASRTRVYIGRKEYFDTLDAHVQKNSEPIVLLGESGAGKSALLANWARKFQEENPDTFLLIHFIGSTTDSADWVSILRRIIGEIKRHYDMPNEIPDTPEKLRAEFPNWLSMAAARGRFVLVLDALNQLEDRDGAPDLVWLPEFIPSEVRLILSTLLGRPLDELKRRGWPTVDILPLEEEERRQLIEDYLAVFTKKLPGNQVERIISERQSDNPLYIHALLNELRVFGIHEEIPTRIDHYLHAKNAKELYELVLERLEKDYGEKIVRDAMSLLWAARRGLSEAELLEILDIPPLAWSPLRLSLNDALISRSGLLGFCHDFLRQAVHDKYLKTFDSEKAAHLHIGNYFEPKEIDDRKIDELPWQLAEANSWQTLYDLLADWAFFHASWEGNKWEIKRYWTEIENHSPLRMCDAYKYVIENKIKSMDLIGTTTHFISTDSIAELLTSAGNEKDALLLREIQIFIDSEIGDLGSLQVQLGGKADVFFRQGKTDMAFTFYQHQADICRQLMENNTSISPDGHTTFLYSLRDIKHSLLTSLNNQAIIMTNGNDLASALDYLKEAEEICREIGDMEGLQANLGNQANIKFYQHEFDVALDLHRQEEEVCRKLGKKEWLQICLGNQAKINKTRGDLTSALSKLREQERICRDLRNMDVLRSCLINQVVILDDYGEIARGDLDVALELLKEAERIFRELGDKKRLRIVLCNQGLVLKARGDLDSAIAVLKEAELICLEMGDKSALYTCLSYQSGVFEERGDLESVKTLNQEISRISRELNN